MTLQQGQLNQLRTWLTETENRISLICAPSLNPTSIETHFAEHKQLQRDLEEQQSIVNSLSNLVVVVDEGHSDSS